MDLFIVEHEVAVERDRRIMSILINDSKWFTLVSELIWELSGIFTVEIIKIISKKYASTEPSCDNEERP